MTPAAFCRTLLPLLPHLRARAIGEIDAAILFDGLGVPRWNKATRETMEAVAEALKKGHMPPGIEPIIAKFPPDIYV